MTRFLRSSDPVYEQGAFDSPSNQKSRCNRKRQAIIETWQSPIWPKLAKILFISMLVLSAAMALVELKHATLGGSFNFPAFLRNATLTLLCIWGFYTLILLICCLAGANANRRDYHRRRAESGIADVTDEDRARTNRAIHRLNRGYLFYIRFSVIGLCLFLLIFVLERLF